MYQQCYDYISKRRVETVKLRHVAVKTERTEENSLSL